ncbi:hypothetical protein K504DRAFT_537430 [Pleomassaria siparia CBS 279.74]|uniref:HTH psq-type domain-containing protein n=1 Tax=Pleomassaria siparia CBS 279.74 TaxID=1314801 RepID=A0A6G1JYX8_9PLEO|nr:hypothetical protein K504DRAFT_537430 [Pleomassaria siparia CBS 279.74]
MRLDRSIAISINNTTIQPAIRDDNLDVYTGQQAAVRAYGLAQSTLSNRLELKAQQPMQYLINTNRTALRHRWLEPISKMNTWKDVEPLGVEVAERDVQPRQILNVAEFLHEVGLEDGHNRAVEGIQESGGNDGCHRANKRKMAVASTNEAVIDTFLRIAEFGIFVRFPSPAALRLPSSANLYSFHLKRTSTVDLSGLPMCSWIGSALVVAV